LLLAMFQHATSQSLASVTALIIGTGMVIRTLVGGTSGFLALLGAFVLVTGVVLAFTAVITARRQLRLAAFAERNGLDFTARADGVRYPGAAFEIRGDRHTHTGVVSGTARGGAFAIGNYKVTRRKRDSDGGHTTTTVTEFGYLVTSVALRLPRILLDAKGNGTLALNRHGLVKWDLEGDFPVAFTTMCVPGQERDMLEVLAPDVMQVFSDYLTDFDIEIIGSRLFLMRKDRHTAAPGEIAAYLAAADRLVVELVERLPFHRIGPTG
jgi:hypothetical protein